MNQEEEKEVAEIEIENETDNSAELNFEQIDAEEVKPFYFNNALIEPPFRLYRINRVGGRIYFRFRNEELMQEPVLYMGTGAITGEMKTPVSLAKYREDKGTFASNYELHLWSLYGSFSDSRIAEFVSNGRFYNGLGGLPAQLKEYYHDQNFFVEEHEFNYLAKCIKNDMIGFERFIYDRKVEFVCVEYGVTSEIDGTATPIDMILFFDREIDVDAYKKDGTLSKKKAKKVERTLGIFNYKSGKIYANHGVQCHAERKMFMESYPDFTTLPVRSFNLTIREYTKANWDKHRGTSDYNKPYQIKDWTDEVNDDEFMHYLELAKIHRGDLLNRPITVVEGDMKLGDEPSQYFIRKTIPQIIADGTWQKFQKSSASIPEEYTTLV